MRKFDIEMPVFVYPSEDLEASTAEQHTLHFAVLATDGAEAVRSFQNVLSSVMLRQCARCGSANTTRTLAGLGGSPVFVVCRDCGAHAERELSP